MTTSSSRTLAWSLIPIGIGLEAIAITLHNHWLQGVSIGIIVVSIVAFGISFGKRCK